MNNTCYVSPSRSNSETGITLHNQIESELMSEFEGVNVVKAANVYFGGQVSSRTVKFADGTVKTLGIMLPGTYEFNTDKPELMEITSGKLDVVFPGESESRSVNGGESFNVPGSSSFKVIVEEVTDYICSFID